MAKLFNITLDIHCSQESAASHKNRAGGQGKRKKMTLFPKNKRKTNRLDAIYSDLTFSLSSFDASSPFYQNFSSHIPLHI